LFRRGPADAAHKAVHGAVFAHQSRLGIAQLGQLNLQLSGPAYCMLGKDIKNKLGAVNDFALGNICQIMQLRRRKFTIKNKSVRPTLQGQHLQFRHLAPAHDQARVHLGDALHHAPGYGKPGCAGQFGQFVQITLLHDAGQGCHRDKQGAGPVFRFMAAFGPAGEVFFQRFGRTHHLGRCAVPRAWQLQMITLPVDVCGQKMRRLPLYRFAHRIDSQDNDGIQAQKEHVHQVFLAEAVGGQVGMQQPKAAQTLAAAAASGQFGYQDAAGLAHNDRLYTALAVNEQAYLPPESA